MTRAQALALYASAADSGDYEGAAHALAAALQPRVKAADGLDVALPRPGKRATVGGVVCEWADGSTTYQVVPYDKPAQRWAAAFQACDRLRRMRARHEWARELGLGSIKNPGAAFVYAGGHWRESADWQAFVKVWPMPELVAIICEESGETFTAPAGYGGGHAGEAAALLSRIIGEPVAVAA